MRDKTVNKYVHSPVVMNTINTVKYDSDGGKGQCGKSCSSPTRYPLSSLLIKNLILFEATMC